jgi:hypothetical protein
LAGALVGAAPQPRHDETNGVPPRSTQEWAILYTVDVTNAKVPKLTLENWKAEKVALSRR